MATSIEHIQELLRQGGIVFEQDPDDPSALRATWMHRDQPMALWVMCLEEGELVQLRAPGLIRASDETQRPLLFRAMLQMAYEIRLVQFEYNPRLAEVSTCIDIALEDAQLSAEQLLRCYAVLIEVSALACDRLNTILETGHDPALDTQSVDQEEAEERQSQLDAMVELARLMGTAGGRA